MIWKFSRDLEGNSRIEVWLSRLSIPAITCDDCGVWMIPITVSDVELDSKLINFIKAAKAPISLKDFEDIKGHIGNDRAFGITPGTALGTASVKRMKNWSEGAVAWFEGTAIIGESDRVKLQEAFPTMLPMKPISNVLNSERLFELMPKRFDLGAMYPVMRCENCGRRNTEIPNVEYLEEIRAAVDLTGLPHSVPGGIMVGDQFREAALSVGLSNISFADWKTR